jgi:hypothetical protein
MSKITPRVTRGHAWACLTLHGPPGPISGLALPVINGPGSTLPKGGSSQSDGASLPCTSADADAQMDVSLFRNHCGMRALSPSLAIRPSASTLPCSGPGSGDGPRSRGQESGLAWVDMQDMPAGGSASAAFPDLLPGLKSGGGAMGVIPFPWLGRRRP